MIIFIDHGDDKPYNYQMILVINIYSYKKINI